MFSKNMKDGDMIPDYLEAERSLTSGIHMIDLLVWFFGNIQNVNVQIKSILLEKSRG